MALKSLFRSFRGKLIPPAKAKNEAGGPAYELTPEHRLAQYAVTGCLNGTFYADAATQLETVLSLCETVDAELIAKTAVYCREKGRMKDVPALLCAVLSVKAPALLEKTFPRVIDGGKMLRNFVQIVRSGAVGRKSLGSLPKRLVRNRLASFSDEVLFKATVGNDPSIADIIKMVHPRPESPGREALYGYILGRPHEAGLLPPIVRAFEAFKADRGSEVPDVPFQMLTSLPLGKDQWRSIAERAPWQMTRMNLNTFARHGVFEDVRLAARIADRIRNADAIRASGVFPYQLLAGYAAARASIPRVVRDALHDAMEIATANVPEIPGAVCICCDVSGSMQSPVTGFRKGSTTAVRCVDVAALIAAVILRRNRNAQVLCFDHRVIEVALEPRDSVFTNARLLASLGGGATACSAPLELLNARGAPVDLVILVSDNESWVDPALGRGTRTMEEWSKLERRNPGARLVCIDIQPYGTTQAIERQNILNVGGFSDAVFDVVGSFAAGSMDPAGWVGMIRKVEV